MTKSVLTALLLTSTCLTGMAQAADITQIELGQSGIVRYTLEADALGNTISFDVPNAASDDVLASLIVRDPAGGVIDLQTDTPGGVNAALAGSLFKDGLPSTTDGLLRALVGEEVSLTTRTGMTTGRLMGVGQTQTIENETNVSRYTALLLGATGVTEVVLTPGTQVAFPEASAKRLHDAMIASNSDPDMRQFDLTLEATGPRKVNLSYVTEAAAWKNSWRLLLDEGRLQGWATLENVSGQDWDDVALTLTTGAPVAFRRDLINPQYHPRDYAKQGPVAPISLEADRGAQLGLMSMSSGSASKKLMARGLATAMPMAEPSKPVNAGVAQQSAGILRYAMPTLVDLDADRTANLMYIDLPIDPEIRGLFRVRDGSKGVILAASLKADQPLASGLVSVQDDKGFVGDAPFNGMLAGQTRLLPYAVSSGSEVLTKVDNARRIESVAIGEKGLVVDMSVIRSTDYSVELPENVTLFSVEHPDGYGKLENANGKTEFGAGFTRITVPVTDGKGAVSLSERRIVSTQYDLSGNSFTALVLELRSGAVAAEPKVVQAFNQAQDMVLQAESLRAQRSDAKSRYARLVDEQKRLRENLEAVQQDALRNRYLKTLDETETNIGASLDAIDAINAQEEELRQAFVNLFNGL